MHAHEDRMHAYADRMHAYEERMHAYADRMHEYADRMHEYEDRMHEYEDQMHEYADRMHAYEEQMHALKYLGGNEGADYLWQDATFAERSSVSMPEHQQSRTVGLNQRSRAWLRLAAAILLMLVGGSPSPTLAAAETNRVAAPSLNRCLLIVETSRAMQRRAGSIVDVIQDLVITGLHRQFQAGDTFGLWTFSDTLQAGQFPLQVWSPENGGEVAGGIVQFLKGQKYTKTGSFEKIWPALMYVVERSERLTVVLLCSGEGKVAGTPFDQQINDFFQRLRSQQQKARTPFVIVFSTYKGRMVDCTLNAPPWPLELPRPVQAPKEIEAKPPPKPQVSPNTIVTSAPPRAASAGAAAPLIISGSRTNKPAAPLAQPLAAPPSRTNVSPAPPITAPTQTVRAATVPLSQPVVPAPAVLPVQSKPAVTPVSASTVVTQAARVVEAKPVPPVTASTNVAPKAVVPASTTNAAAPVPPSPPPAKAATAQAPASGHWHKWLVIVAGGVVIVAGVGVFLWLRRSKPAPQGSLITRSYHRHEK